MSVESPALEPGTAAGRVYLPGLNGVRCIAAISVMIHHIEQAKATAGLSHGYSPDRPVIFRAGELGVTLFFVLSGFLISYLLLTEIRMTGSVQIQNFYIRRILRIWPLYFFIVGLAWVVTPLIPLFHFPMFQSPFGPGYLSRIAFFLLLCPQLAFPRLVTPTLAGPLWSVGVEEHFYAFWPWLVRGFRGKLLLPCLGILLGLIVARAEVRHLLHVWKDPTRQEWLTWLGNVLYWSRFGCMAIGGIGAWLCLAFRDRISPLFRRDMQAVVLGGLLILLYRGQTVRFADQEFYAVLFVILIMNIATNPKTLVRLEGPLFRFLGEISYGLYVYHWFMAVLVLNLLGKIGGIEQPILRNAFIYGGVVGLTVAVAWLSYRFLERPFLRRKDSFAVILSGTSARTDGA
jgi:peptidoglycan/LPS O-acetylase OafA/YrhL